MVSLGSMVWLDQPGSTDDDRYKFSMEDLVFHITLIQQYDSEYWISAWGQAKLHEGRNVMNRLDL